IKGHWSVPQKTGEDAEKQKQDTDAASAAAEPEPSQLTKSVTPIDPLQNVVRPTAVRPSSPATSEGKSTASTASSPSPAALVMSKSSSPPSNAGAFVQASPAFPEEAGKASQPPPVRDRVTPKNDFPESSRSPPFPFSSKKRAHAEAMPRSHSHSL